MAVRNLKPGSLEAWTESCVPAEYFLNKVVNLDQENSTSGLLNAFQSCAQKSKVLNSRLNFA